MLSRFGTILTTLGASCLLLSPAARAQCGYEWSAGAGQEFPGTHGPVTTGVSFDADGPGPAQPLLVLAGDFTAAGLTPNLHGVVAFDGSNWLDMDSAAFDHPPTGLHVLNGRLYAAGGFTLRHGQPGGGIAEFDVATWTWRGVAGGVNGTVLDSDVFNGEVVVGGSFTSAGNAPPVAAHNIAAWNGSAWRELGTGGLSVSVRELQAAGPQLVARVNLNFPHGWMALANNIWSEIPSIDNPFQFSGLYTVDQTVCAGSIQVMAGTVPCYVQQWTGSQWLAPSSSSLRTFTLQNGEVYSTSFLRSSGSPVWGFRLTAGRFSVGPEVGQMLGGSVYPTLETAPCKLNRVLSWRDKTVFLGDFDWIDRIPAANVMCRVGGQWSPPIPGLSKRSTYMAAGDGLPTIIQERHGYSFAVPEVLRMTPEGTWRPLGPDTWDERSVDAVASQHNITYVGGGAGISKFDGTSWVASLVDNALGIQFFHHLGYLCAAWSYARPVKVLNDSTGLWENLGPAVQVQRIVDVDGTLFANLTPAGGTLGYYTFTNNQWSLIVQPPANWTISALGSYRGRLVVAASTSGGTAGRAFFVGLYESGVWSVLGTTPPFSTTSQGPTGLIEFDHRLFAFGAMNGFGSLAYTGLAMWNGTQWTNAGFDLRFNNSASPSPVWQAAVHGDELCLSGDFDSAGGNIANTFVRLRKSPRRCAIDFNCDGGVDGSDMAEFFTLWESGNIDADVDNSGAVDGGDVAAFFTAFGNGC